MIKLIACDIDGTILNDDCILTKRTKDAIIEAEKQGIQVVLCSGRSQIETMIFMEENSIKLDSILLNGSLIIDKNGNPVIERNIDKELINKIDVITKGNIVEYHCKNRTLIKASKADFIEAWNEFKVCDYEYLRKEFDFYWRQNDSDYCDDIENIINEGVIKIEVLFTKNKAELIKVIETLPVNVTTSNYFNNIEITELNSSKGETLMMYCDLKGIKPDETIVIGDSMNDKSMFDLFENSVAVANAQEELKNVAKYITLSNNKDGVALVIESVLERNV